VPTSAPKLVVLDESHQTKHHPILSVGGIIVDHARVPEIETAWREAKAAVGLGPEQAVKFSESWNEPRQRADLFCRIAELPISCLITLLEDFRPMGMKLRKETRKDLYIHGRAFEYVLQRLVGVQFIAAGGGPHLVAIDRRDDAKELHETYSSHYRTGWIFGSHQIPSLKDHGFAETLLVCDRGPLHEIADFIVSGMTGWVGARCAVLKGKTVSDLDERNEMCRAVVRLFPSRAIPESWRGWSFITHKGDITGKELIAQNIDAWLREMAAPPPPAKDNIPF